MNKKYMIAAVSICILLLGTVFYKLTQSGNIFSSREDVESVGENRADIAEDKVAVEAQNDNKFKLTLDFQSRDRAKSIARYYIALYPAAEDGNAAGLYPMNIATYDDQIVLQKGKGGAQRHIVYAAPRYLKGKYAIVVNYVDEGGTITKSFPTGSFDLQGFGENFIEILPGSCWLTIAGEGEDKKYTIVQGVDVKSDEELLMTCKAKNNFSHEMTVFPQFVNYRQRNLYADEAVSQEGKRNELITFASHEVKDVTVAVQKAVDPEAYDVAMFFVDENGHRVSTKAFAHYVVAGQAAGVSDVTLDRNGYTAGDQAHVTLSYYGSVDAFENARLGGTPKLSMTMNIDMKNAAGESCLVTKSASVIPADDLESNRKITLDVKKNCTDPYVVVDIVGSDNKTMFAQEFLHAKSF